MTINTAISGTGTLIYTPAKSGTPTFFVTNTGPSVVYLGQANVQPGGGFPLYTNQTIDLSNQPSSIYAVSGVTPTATTTTSTAAANSGATAVAVTSGTGIANGAIIQIGSGSNAETTSVTSGGGTLTLTVPALQLDHRTGAAVTVMTAAGSVLSVVPGTF